MDLYDGATASTTRDALPSAGTPGYFSDGTPGTKPRTTLEGWYMQLLVDEIMAVIAAAAITPNRAVTTQLRDAINDLIGAGMLTPFLNHASAATCDIGAAVSGITSPNANITGTTTITSFGSSASASRPVYVLKFAGALTLTHNATSLICPGGGNIVTAAGDYAIADYLGSGNWRIAAYFRASAAPQMPQIRAVLKIQGSTGNVLKAYDPAGIVGTVTRSSQGIYTIAHSSTGWPAEAYGNFCLHDSSRKAGIELAGNNTALLTIYIFDTTVAGTLDADFTVEIKF